MLGEGGFSPTLQVGRLRLRSEGLGRVHTAMSGAARVQPSRPARGRPRPAPCPAYKACQKDARRGLQSSDRPCVAGQLGPGSKKQRVPVGRRPACARSAEPRRQHQARRAAGGCGGSPSFAHPLSCCQDDAQQGLWGGRVGKLRFRQKELGRVHVEAGQGGQRWLPGPRTALLCPC